MSTELDVANLLRDSVLAPKGVATLLLTIVIIVLLVRQIQNCLGKQS